MKTPLLLASIMLLGLLLIDGSPNSAAQNFVQPVGPNRQKTLFERLHRADEMRQRHDKERRARGRKTRL